MNSVGCFIFGYIVFDVWDFKDVFFFFGFYVKLDCD